MNVVTMSKRFAATGAVAALATTGLVGLSTTAANANPVVTNAYSCAFGQTTFPIALTTNAVGIEGFPSIPAGYTVGAGLLTVTNTFTIPDQVHSALGQFNVTSISAPTFAGDFGGNPVHVDGVSVTLAGMTQNGDTSWSSDSTTDDGDAVEGNGVNADFVVPKAGTYDIFSPAALDLVATTGSGGSIPVSCTIAPDTTAGAYHHIEVVRNVTDAAAKATKKSFVKGKAAKVKATITGGAELKGDKVLLKKGSKTLDTATLNADGIATLSTKKLPVGKNKLTVVYKKTDFNESSKAPVAVKVVK